MKKVIAIVTTFILFCFSSCCTKKKCYDFYDSNGVQISNFSKLDADSIAVEIFENGSNFMSRIDSVFTSATFENSNNLEATIQLSENVDRNHDYKITFLSLGKVYTMTSFETEKVTCNNCFPYHPANDYYKKLVSYKVNGQLQYSSELTIEK